MTVFSSRPLAPKRVGHDPKGRRLYALLLPKFGRPSRTRTGEMRITSYAVIVVCPPGHLPGHAGTAAHRVEVHGCDLFTFRDGLIAVKDSYRKNRPPLVAARS